MVKFTYGENVLVCEPFVSIVLDEFREKRCNYCLNECSSLKKCGNCRRVAYCSKECQEKDWKNVHKFKECKLLQSSTLESFDQHCFVRYILKVTLDPVARTKVWKLWDGKECKISDLVSHGNHFKRTKPELGSFLMKIMNEMNNVLKQKFSIDDMWEFYGQFKTNSIMFGEVFANPLIATAVYVEISAITHSCRPNTASIYAGSTLKIRAINVIDTSIEQPTMAFVTLNVCREERRAALQQTFFFVCRCQRCESHDDKDIDFKQLSTFNESNRFNVEYWENKIELMQRIYGEIHPMILPMMVKHWDAMVYNNLELTVGRISDEAVSKMGNQCAIIDNRFEIALGRDHQSFKDWEQYGILWNNLRWSKDRAEVFRDYFATNFIRRQELLASAAIAKRLSNR